MEKMDYELRFVNMLGYRVVPLYETRWNVLDENGKKVGFIQRKKLISKNVKKGTKAQYGYVMEIDNDKLSYKGARLFSKPTSIYEFDVKRENGEMDHVDLKIDRFPTLTMWSKRYGFINFNIDYKGLFVSYKDKTENFNIEEIISFYYKEAHANEFNKEYIYQINYCDKDLNLDDDTNNRRISRQLIGYSRPLDEKLGVINVTSLTFRNQKLVHMNDDKFLGTIEDMVIKHKDGIDAVSHFRYKLNEILPFKKEIMGELLSEVTEPVIPMIEYFFPDVYEDQNKGVKKKTKK